MLMRKPNKRLAGARNMEYPQKTLQDMRWVALDGTWDADGERLVFSGGDMTHPLPSTRRLDRPISLAVR
jgi:hypothetical protein